jgi:tetratricopeptide (TPR) repeat protein
MNRLFVLPILIVLMISAPVQLFAAKSITEYTKAIDQSPVDRKYKFYLLRGEAHMENGDFSAALKDFSTSIQLKPNKEAFLNRGKMYFQRGTLNMAIKDFSEAIEINPTLDVYKLRGLTYLVQGSLELAIKDGTEVIKLAPNVSDSYNIRMEAYAQIGEFKLAREDARRALSLDRRNKVAQEVLVKNPEKITLEGSRSRYKSIQVENYKIWANSQGYAFTLKDPVEMIEQKLQNESADQQQRK